MQSNDVYQDSERELGPREVGTAEEQLVEGAQSAAAAAVSDC